MLRIPQIERYEEAPFELNELLKIPCSSGRHEHALNLQRIYRRKTLRMLKISLSPHSTTSGQKLPISRCASLEPVRVADCSPGHAERWKQA
jgi:hypothetical protein